MIYQTHSGSADQDSPTILRHKVVEEEVAEEEVAEEEEEEVAVAVEEDL